MSKHLKHLELSLLNDWLYNLPDKEFENITTHRKEDAPRRTQDEFDLGYYLSETAPKFETWLEQQCFYLGTRSNGEKVIYYDLDNFDNINVACAAIRADYDDDFETLRKLGCFPPYRNADGSPAEGTPWKKWGLRGDDDVDYNGGYITIALDILIAYEKAHGGEQARVTNDGTPTNQGTGTC